MCHLNSCIKKWGSPSSFRRKRPFISLNSSAFIENLSSSDGARARARANHARNDAQKGCVMQLNGITLKAPSDSATSINLSPLLKSDYKCSVVRGSLAANVPVFVLHSVEREFVEIQRFEDVQLQQLHLFFG